MQEHTLQFNFHARYYMLGKLDENTNRVWFVLHGYGQLARYFLPKFQLLQQKGICVIAPEGLSRFYLEDVTKRNVTGSKRVGATWMTAENRLMDIENYIAYLQQIYTDVIGSHACSVSLLGFSQGAATASRWALRHPENFTRLILWAGIIPPDMDFEKGKEVFGSKQITIVYGKNDPFLNDARLTEMTTLVNRLSVSPDIITFDGGHEIDEKTLERLS
ncbi:MAG: hypothetical protein KF845_05770 [Cyclobacteriaceae bacterium]|nr:hypothetical protein [Cyclobacteriaceae bacterium]